MIELFNEILFKQKYGKIVTTSDNKAIGLRMAAEEVEKRIITKRTMKLDKEL